MSMSPTKFRGEKVQHHIRCGPGDVGRFVRHHVGVSHSKDSFFGQHEPQRMPVGHELQDRWNAWVQAGVMCSEMEASTLFVVARLLGRRAGGIMLAGGTANDLSNLIE